MTDILPMLSKNGLYTTYHLVEPLQNNFDFGHLTKYQCLSTLVYCVFKRKLQDDVPHQDPDI